MSTKQTQFKCTATTNNSMVPAKLFIRVTVPSQVRTAEGAGSKDGMQQFAITITLPLLHRGETLTQQAFD